MVLLLVGSAVFAAALPGTSGFFFQIRLRPTRTDAAALCPLPLAFTPPAASILNSLGETPYKKELLWENLLYGKVG